MLKSPQFDATSKSGMCMNFWYHMSGSTVGDLKVYFRSLNGATTTKSEIMWSLSGNQGNKWMQGRIGIQMKTNYMV